MEKPCVYRTEKNFLYSHSVGSLSDKILRKSFEMKETNKVNNEYTININDISMNLPEVQSIKVNKLTDVLELNFLKHKMTRREFAEKEDPKTKDGNINRIIPDCRAQESKRLFEYKIDCISQFYINEAFQRFSSLNEYNNLIQFHLNHNTPVANDTRGSSFHRWYTFLEDNIFENPQFLKHYITLNKISSVHSQVMIFYKTSLLGYLLRKLEAIFNMKKRISKIFITGQKGCGKSYALMIYSLFLRLNPYNIVISIFNISEFIDNPVQYLINETLQSLYYLYTRNSLLSLSTLENFFYTFQQKSSTVENVIEILNEIQQLIEQAFKAYDMELNFYLIIDEYDKIYTDGKVNEVVRCVEILFGKIIGSESKEEGKCKMIQCGNTTNNDLIIHMLKEISTLDDSCSYSYSYDEILDNHIIFLKAGKIITLDELISYIEKKFGKKYQASLIRDIITQSCHNFFYINSFFNSWPRDVISLEQFFLNMRRNMLKDYLESKAVSLDSKAWLLYSLRNYKNISTIPDKKEIISKRDFFAKGGYRNYIYQYLIPSYENEVVTLDFESDLIRNFISTFNFESMIPLIEIDNVSMESYKEWYNQTSDNFLKGIFIEELTYLFFKHARFFDGKRQYFHMVAYDLFSKNDITQITSSSSSSHYGLEEYDSRINNINNLFPGNASTSRDKILIKLEQVHKFYSFEDDIFEGNNILKSRNGIYFLSQRFPIIDAVIINREVKNIILVQIKKTISRKHLFELMDNFHYLYFLMENEEAYQEILVASSFENLNTDHKTSFFCQNTGNILSKLQFFIKIATLLKQSEAWTLNFMFVYKHKEKGFEFDSSYIVEKTYIKLIEQANEAVSCKCPGLFKAKFSLLGHYIYDGDQIILNRRKIMMNVLMVDLDDFTKGLIDDHTVFSSFI